MRARTVFLSTAVSLLLAASFAPPVHAGDDSAVRVLLVGNSYTRYHQMHLMLRRLGQHDPSSPRLVVRSETRPGCTLRRHWMHRDVTPRIRSGWYTHVVLQGHSLRPLDRPQELATYARRFDELIDAAGAKTVLYATWAREEGSGFYQERDELDGPRSMQRRIDEVYGSLAHDLDAEIAPVGNAWMMALHLHPDLDLHGNDGAHPTIAGSYLTAAVLYGTVTGLDPRPADYTPYPLEDDVARELRAIAAAALGH